MTRYASLFAVAVLVGFAPSAQAQVKLEYKFHEGSKTINKEASKTHQILSINGMDIETTSDTTVTVSSAVGKRNAEGNLPIAHKIESLRSQIDLPGGINIAFDSANPDATKIEIPQVAFLADVFKAMVGVNYTIVLDGSNKAKFVEGTEPLTAKLETMKPEAAALLRSQLSADNIKKEFDEHHSNLPTVLAREGEPWEVTDSQDIGGDQTMTFRKRYEYKGEVKKDGKTLDKIQITATDVTYAMDPNSQSPFKVTKSDLKVESSEGTILFDREAGHSVESKMKVRVKGTLTLKINDMELPSTLDLTLENSSSPEKAAK